VRLLLVSAALGSSLACASPARPIPRVVAADALSPLLALLPAVGHARCAVVLPQRLDPTHAAQAALVSQSDGLPFRLGLEAYVRVEREGARVELLRFASAPAQAVVRAQLSGSLERALCEADSTCRAAELTWLDARTLRIARGELTGEGESACAALLRAHPRALEVAARPPSIASGELRETRVILEATHEGLARTSERRYSAPEAAERALRAALRGQEELPTLAGVPADDFGERVGDTLVQRTFVGFDDLQLALDDRARRAHRRPVDPRDLAAVYAAYDAQPDEALLLAARAQAPDDDGLLQRHFSLLFARDPRAAYALAQTGHGDAWQLRKRLALTRFDEAGLARALQDAYKLRDASAMARELAAQASPTPAAQERAELTFLAAARIAKARVNRTALALRVAVLELPRLIGTLAQSVRPTSLHLLAFSNAEHAQRTLGAGRSAVLLAAADDAQLRELGVQLGAVLEDGPFELRIELEHGATLALSGRREGGWLLVDHGSRALKLQRWDAIERLVAAPLRKLQGSAFPPDELVIEARDERELSALEQSAQRVTRCSREGLTLHCRGSLADAGAARRALLALAHDQLANELRALWSGTD
jgi:hypothetical protein